MLCDLPLLSIPVGMLIHGASQSQASLEAKRSGARGPVRHGDRFRRRLSISKSTVRAPEHADALQIGVAPLFDSNSDQIIALAARNGVPTVCPWPEFTARGGLTNYGTSILNMLRQVGNYTGQILNGATPADLPVQRPTKLAFDINLKTAKALGLD